MNYEKTAVQAVIAFRRNLIMNKTELVAAVAEQAGLSKKDAEAAVKAFTDVVAEALKAGDKIAASKAPKFKAGKALKDLVNA